MRLRPLALLILVPLLLPSLALTEERSSPPTQRLPLTPDAQHELRSLRDKVNEGTVGIIGGGIEGTYLRAATELADVLDGTSDGLRILPIAGKGSLENIWDIVFLRGVDVGLVQADVLAYAEREKIFPKLGSFLQYISSLYGEEVHVLARRDIRRIEDLAGKKVNIDNRRSGTFLTATLLFKELKIPIETATDDQALALERLKRGEIDALVYVAGKPVRLFTGVKRDDNLHFLAIPTTPELQRIYFSATLRSEDYPNLIEEGATVPVIGVDAVMAVYAWPPQSERYRKVARFVDAFFSHLSAFQQPPRHPKWHEISQLVLAQPLAGWTRFPEADKWLRSAAVMPQMRERFEAFLDKTRPGETISAGEREALFAEYLQRQAGNEALFTDFLKWRTQGSEMSGSSTPPRGEGGQGGEDEAAGSAAPALRLAPDAVKQIQSSLQAQGIYAGAIDGILGAETAKAIGAFQRSRGREQASVIDLETLRSLTEPQPAR